jgi:hypothetical protein
MKEIFKFKHDIYSTVIYQDFSDINSFIQFRGNKKYFLSTNCTKDTEKDFVDNYGNPLSDVSHSYQLIVISSDETKVSLKFFSGVRYRKVLTNYFRKSTLCQFITVSKKTGDLYTGKLVNYHKKRKVSKVFYKNNFSINNFLSIYSSLRVNDYKNSENIEKVQELFHQIIYFFLQELNIKYVHTTDFNINREILKYYASKKQIKYPDNISAYLNEANNQLKLKEIRKFGNKFIDAFMDKWGLSGKVIKKALHNCQYVNISILKTALNLFGKDWVYQDYDFVLCCLNSKMYCSTFFGYETTSLNFLSTTEKRRAFLFFKEYLLKSSIFNFSTFIDHLRMIEELRYLGENDVIWKSTNIHEFNEEHQNFASKIEYYKKGFYIRVYEKYVSDSIQKPIIVEEQVYYPILIKDTDEYVEESYVQSNCVKTYIGNPGSYIVSLRKSSKDSDERATIEFYLTKYGKEVPYFQIKQSLGKFNQSLGEEWEKPIQTLLGRFAQTLQHKNFQPVKIQKIFNNGKKLSSDTYWDEKGHLKWSSVDLTSYYYEHI